jgi:hypothetical protein
MANAILARIASAVQTPRVSCLRFVAITTVFAGLGLAAACSSDPTPGGGGGAADAGADTAAAQPDTGGGSTTSSGSSGEAPPPRRIFVTSFASNAAFGGIAGADQRCNDLAKGANMVGTFRAWLAVGTTTPASRIPKTAMGYIRTDGVLVALSFTDLTDGNLSAAIDADEKGNKVPAGTLVWTNVKTDGNARDATSYDCDGFTKELATVSSTYGGRTAATDGEWTNAPNPIPCSGEARLYCLEN